MKKVTLFLLLCVAFSASSAVAASRSRCPDKVLEEGSAEGVYQGMEVGDYCHVTLKLDNGEEFSLLADEEDVVKIFGESMGQRAFIAYEVQQFWNEGANECMRVEVMTSGKILSASSGQKEQGKEKAFEDIHASGEAERKKDEKEQQAKAVADAKFMETNSDKAIALVKKSDAPRFPQSEGYPNIGKAFETFFSKPNWGLRAMPTATGGLFWQVVFKGVAKYGNQNAQFTIIIDVKPEAVKTQDVASLNSWSIAIEVNGRPVRDAADIWAAIFLN